MYVQRLPCFAKKAMLFSAAVKFKVCKARHTLPLSLHTSNELPIQCLYYPTVCLHSRCHARLKKRCGSEREVFCARFATFCRAFQNTFYPMLAHFSTLSMAGFLPGGWVGLDGTQQLCTAPWHRLKAKTDASKLSANE